MKDEAKPNAATPEPRWWQRLVAWLEKRRPVTRGESIDVGSGYRHSHIDVPASVLWYIRAIEWIGQQTDPIIDKLPRILRWTALIVMISAAASVITLGLYWLFRGRTTTATVSATRWLYRVNTIERNISHDNDWRNNVRAHAFNVACVRAVRSHHDCNARPCVRTYLAPSGRRGGMRVVVRPSICYDSCPDYDDRCEYDYPEWLADRSFVRGGTDHTPIRPTNDAISQYACVDDNETIFAQHHVSSCSVDVLSFVVQFDAGATGHWQIEPARRGEFNMYNMGDRWSVEYNHAGRFRPIAKYGTWRRDQVVP